MNKQKQKKKRDVAEISMQCITNKSTNNSFLGLLFLPVHIFKIFFSLDFKQRQKSKSKKNENRKRYQKIK